VPGRIEHLRHRAFLDDPAQQHDLGPVAQITDHPQVMRDEDERQIELLLQIGQKRKDLRLHRHIEARHDLVADQRPRLDHQRPDHGLPPRLWRLPMTGGGRSGRGGRSVARARHGCGVLSRLAGPGCCVARSAAAQSSPAGTGCAAPAVLPGRDRMPAPPPNLDCFAPFP